LHRLAAAKPRRARKSDGRRVWPVSSGCASVRPTARSGACSAGRRRQGRPGRLHVRRGQHRACRQGACRDESNRTPDGERQVRSARRALDAAQAVRLRPRAGCRRHVRLDALARRQAQARSSDPTTRRAPPRRLPRP
jgi:hypothetical protein